MEGIRKRVDTVGVIIIAGLVIRLLLSPFFADSNDFPYWVGVSFDIVNGDGIYRGYDLWYPPVWGYLISLVTPILELFNIAPMEYVADGASEYGYRVGYGLVVSPGAVFILKLPLIVADCVCGLLVFLIAGRLTDDRRKQLAALSLWMFCPLTIYVSAVQGQIEPLGTMFLLLAIWSSLRGSYFPAGAFIAASVLTKPFTALAVLPLLAMVWRYGKTKKERNVFAAKYVAGGVLMSLFIVLPQMINGEMSFVTGFLTDRYSTSPPLPSDFTMSIAPLSDAFALSDLYPSTSNLNKTLILSMLVSLILTVFAFMKDRLEDRDAILIVAASVCSSMMWYSATGYVQYYVPIISMLALCMVYDRRFSYAAYAVTIFALIPAFHSFTNAMQLYDLGWVSMDALNTLSDILWNVLDIPDGVASNLKFIPVLLSVILCLLLARREPDA